MKNIFTMQIALNINKKNKSGFAFHNCSIFLNLSAVTSLFQSADLFIFFIN